MLCVWGGPRTSPSCSTDRMRCNALAVYRNPCMNPPADLRKSLPWLRVPAKYRPGTLTDWYLLSITAYFEFGWIIGCALLEKIDVSCLPRRLGPFDAQVSHHTIIRGD